jgi:hypothetical protein
MYTKEIDDVPDEIEDATEYGEFVPTLFVWLTPEEQRKRVEHLGKVIDTKKEKKEKISF